MNKHELRDRRDRAADPTVTLLTPAQLVVIIGLAIVIGWYAHKIYTAWGGGI